MRVKYDKVLDVMREDDLDGGTIAVDAEFTGNVVVGDAITDTLTINSQVKKLIFDNAVWLQGLNNAEDANINILKVNTSDEIDVGATLNIGPIDLAEDSGAVTVINLPVSATPADGTEESFSFAIDSNIVLKVKGSADSAGGADEFQVLVANGLTALPSISFISDIDTGLGWAGADALSLISGAIEGIRLTEVSNHVIQANEAHVGLTADVGSVQGGLPLLSSFNVISTSGTAGDSCTLPAIFKVGTRITIKNDAAANAVDVFPASGDNLGAGADTAASLAAGASITYMATVADSTWTSI